MKAAAEKSSGRNINTFAVKHALLVRGMDQNALAAKVNCGASFISLLLAGKRRSEVTENKIAQVLGIPRSMIWQS